MGKLSVILFFSNILLLSTTLSQTLPYGLPTQSSGGIASNCVAGNRIASNGITGNGIAGNGFTNGGLVGNNRHVASNGLTGNGGYLGSNAQPNSNLVGNVANGGYNGLVGNVANGGYISSGFNVNNLGNGYEGNAGAAVSPKGFGGNGYGECAIQGELPISGNTAINGNLPVTSYVTFEGSIPANGYVSITGNTPCIC